MTDTSILSTFTVANLTVVRFLLVTGVKHGVTQTYVVMRDANNRPFEQDDVSVATGAFIQFLNFTGGELRIFLQKNDANVPATPLADNARVLEVPQGNAGTVRQVKEVLKGEEAFTFSAVALTASGDLAFFDPRIIIKSRALIDEAGAK
jgi:hypothetical protein